MRLEDIGFAHAGEWRLAGSGGPKSGVKYHLTSLSAERVVYAFVASGGVKYVGACAEPRTTLKDRMERYQSRAGAGTNERVAGLIRSALEAGEAVEIWALSPPPGGSYKGVPVDLVKGLENPLIEILDPEWNRAARKKPVEPA